MSLVQPLSMAHCGHFSALGTEAWQRGMGQDEHWKFITAAWLTKASASPSRVSSSPAPAPPRARQARKSWYSLSSSGCCTGARGGARAGPAETAFAGTYLGVLVVHSNHLCPGFPQL